MRKSTGNAWVDKLLNDADARDAPMLYKDTRTFLDRVIGYFQTFLFFVAASLVMIAIISGLFAITSVIPVWASVVIFIALLAQK